MATKYVTLKDSNGDTLYPQAVATNLAPGSIDTTELADGAVTSAKLKGWSTANTTDEWVPVATSTRELQHRLIKPFNADGTIPTTAIADSAVTSDKIDWSTTRAHAAYSTYIGNSPAANNQWRHIGTLTFTTHQQGKMVWIRMLVGLGNNGANNQCAYIDLIGQLGWTGSLSGRAGWSSVFCTMNTGASLARAVPKVIATSSTVYEIWLNASSQYTSVTGVFIPGFDANGAINAQWTPDYTSSWTSTEPSGTACNISTQRIIPTA